MSLDTLLRQDIQIITPATGTDDYGNTTFDWVNATSVTVKGWIQQATSTEVSVGRDTVVADHTLFLHATAVITAYARVWHDGRTFEVVGLPDVMDRPAAGHHLEVHLRSIDG